MKPNKLSRRERALIQHALRRYEASERLTIYAGTRELMIVTLQQIRLYNRLAGRPKGLRIYYGTGTQIHVEGWPDPTSN